MKHSKQLSETLLLGAMLAIVGGLLDAYTFICRGGVFANAQTGNIVLVGIKIAQKNYKDCFYHLVPVLSFFVGILVTEYFRHKFKESNRIHWRQIVIAFEIVILAIISFIPENENTIANILVSFVCSMQVQSFRKINGNAYATTMCTGNLRSATECLYAYTTTKDKNSLHKSFQYYAIIGFFIIGAAVGTFLVKYFNKATTLFACGILIIVFLLMFIRTADSTKESN